MTSIFIRIGCASILFGVSICSIAQTNNLLEACNSLEKKEKRMECLKELFEFNKKDESTNSKSAALRRLKAAFAGISGSVNAGLSYNNYKTIIIDPARELGIFKQEVPAASNEALESLDAAVMAYNDAERLWRASIYESQDGGIFFGKILNYKNAGLTDIVLKYNIPTETVLMNPHVSANQALPIIWRFAEQAARLSIEILEGKSDSNKFTHESFPSHEAGFSSLPSDSFSVRLPGKNPYSFVDDKK